MVLGDALIVSEAVIEATIDAEMVFEFTVAGIAQVSELVTSQDTASPLLSVVVVKIAVVSPVGNPFTNQLYCGFAPPFVAVAVNSIAVPWHTDPVGVAEIDIAGGQSVFWFILM